ncbi:hypothetical protein JCGZ_21255 [Jatropha curcas]|uniref:Uncharacterized protein n=1 Tax=Jatropha curcas TaxID=180498 RepID=A0A067JMQ8_JATCU|nr:hypothetical protein JCGZ_21255 [Jatropha curcas]
MTKPKMSYRGLKICCGVSLALLLTIAVVLIVLFFTLFKPKEPTFTTPSVTIEHFRAAWPALFLNFTLGIGVTVSNKNYGGFMYEESIGYVSYRGNLIGEAPIAADTIPARGKHDVKTSVTIFANKLFDDDTFVLDFLSGVLNVTSSLSLHGKVIVFKLFKLKAESLSTCNISIFIVPQQAQSVCNAKISF